MECFPNTGRTLLITRRDASPREIEDRPTSASQAGHVSRPNRGRRRSKDPDNGACNEAKQQRNRGEEYTSRKGKTVQRRELKSGCGVGCRQKFKDKISHEKRLKFFHGFWKLGCLTRQRDFLIKSVEKVKKKCSKQWDTSRRKRSYRWHLSVEDNKHEACKTFFLRTLDISEEMVFSA